MYHLWLIPVLLFLFACEDHDQSKSNQNVNTVYETVEIFLINNLDESRGFCLDIKGYKSSASIDKGLQAHTCYSYQGAIAVDQGFELVRLNDNEFFMPNFDVCMESESSEKSSNLILKSCSKKELQKFILNNDGKIYLEGNKNLCLTITQENSREGGGSDPVHLIRDISMETCDESLSLYQAWGKRGA